jgi:hypothetical protein
MKAISVKKRSLTVSLVRKVTLHRVGEDRQPVEQAGRGNGDVLRQLVPHHPVAGDAEDEHQPEQRHAGEPGVPAHAAVATAQELARQVQDHGDHGGIRGVTVQAAHHAAGVPLLVRDALQRQPGAAQAGVVEDEQVDAADQHDPEQVDRQRAEVMAGLFSDSNHLRTGARVAR